MLGGGFSRLGYSKRILTAIGVAAVDRIAGFGVQAVADDTVWLNLLQYAVPLAAIVWGLSQVFQRPARVPRSRRAPVLAAPAGAT